MLTILAAIADEVRLIRMALERQAPAARVERNQRATTVTRNAMIHALEALNNLGGTRGAKLIQQQIKGTAAAPANGEALVGGLRALPGTQHWRQIWEVMKQHPPAAGVADIDSFISQCNRPSYDRP